MTMQPIPFERVRAGGDLADRLLASASRLADDDYGPEQAYKPASYDWPGDNEGRTILAQTLTGRAAGIRPRHLEAILKRLPDALNERGYFGRLLPEGQLDEQQLAGNSWFLRGMLEYEAWTGDAGALAVAERVARELLLPARGSFAGYPADPTDRASLGGEAAGRLVEEPVRGWYLSTDIGCAFIMLDGATHAYERLHWPELRELAEEMAAAFIKLDLRGISAQTHATLSALRGILRLYTLTGDSALLAGAEAVYRLYETEGMTDNQANYNWFNRPWWTEPCAVVDSFIVAVELWRHTKRSDYLETAHRIYYNALSHGQRHNGGFGCDNCAGASEPELYALEGIYEATWCCTMRGGEGLARALQFGFCTDGDTIAVPFYNDGVVRLPFPDGNITVKLTTRYPFEGQVVLEVITTDADAVPARVRTLRFFLPSWAVPGSAALKVNGTPIEAKGVENGLITFDAVLGSGTVITFNFGMGGLRMVEPVNLHGLQGASSFHYGPLLLHAGEIDPQAAQSLLCAYADGSLVHQGLGVYVPVSGAAAGLDRSEGLLRPVYVPFSAATKALKLMRKRVLFIGGGEQAE